MAVIGIKILILVPFFAVILSETFPPSRPSAEIISLDSKQILFSNFTYLGIGDNRRDINYVTLEDPLGEGSASRLKYHYKFECTASFPVEWRYEGEVLPSLVPYSRRTLGKLPDFRNVSTYGFSATLFVTHNEKATGKYICQPCLVEAPNASAVSLTAYVFFRGKKFFILDNPEPSLVFRPNSQNGANDSPLSFYLSNKLPINVEIRRDFLNKEPSQQWITIPCLGSSFPAPDSVHLYKLIQNGSAILSLRKSDSLLFDPFRGFRLKTSLPWGDYICNFKEDGTSLGVAVLPENDDSYLTISLNPPESSELNPNMTDEIEEPSTNEERILINCSTSYPSIHVQHVPCFSVMDCAFRKIVLKNSFVPLEIVVPAGGSAVVPYLTSRQTSIPMKGASPPRSTPVLPVTGIFYCSAGRGRMETLMFFRLKDNTISVLDDGVPERDDMETLELRAHQSVLVGGTDGSFTCFGSTLYFSNGFVWKTVMENGKEEFLRGDEILGGGEHFIENWVRISIPKDGEGLRSLTCFAPVWNSNSEWGNITMEFGGDSRSSALRRTDFRQHFFLLIPILITSILP